MDDKKIMARLARASLPRRLSRRVRARFGRVRDDYYFHSFVTFFGDKSGRKEP